METCSCCDYKTLCEKGGYEICPICFWEDDIVQFEDPNYEGGANKVSLKKAQMNFTKFGACEERFLCNVRKPNEDDTKDLNWKPLVDNHD